jgi:hypothetical protein
MDMDDRILCVREGKEVGEGRWEAKGRKKRKKDDKGESGRKILQILNVSKN